MPRNKKYDCMSKDFSNSGQRLSRPQAVRMKCVDCMGGDLAEVRRCDVKTCPLWPWRMGSLESLRTAEKSREKDMKKQEKELKKQNQQGRKERTCGHCGKMGHDARNCPSKKKGKK